MAPQCSISRQFECNITVIPLFFMIWIKHNVPLTLEFNIPTVNFTFNTINYVFMSALFSWKSWIIKCILLNRWIFANKQEAMTHHVIRYAALYVYLLTWFFWAETFRVIINGRMFSHHCCVCVCVCGTALVLQFLFIFWISFNFDTFWLCFTFSNEIGFA